MDRAVKVVIILFLFLTLIFCYFGYRGAVANHNFCKRHYPNEVDDCFYSSRYRVDYDK